MNHSKTRSHSLDVSERGNIMRKQDYEYRRKRKKKSYKRRQQQHKTNSRLHNQIRLWNDQFIQSWVPEDLHNTTEHNQEAEVNQNDSN